MFKRNVPVHLPVQGLDFNQPVELFYFLLFKFFVQWFLDRWKKECESWSGRDAYGFDWKGR
jgi:hypothetical protein